MAIQTTRDEADDLLDDANLYDDPDRPVHTLAELSDAYEIPIHAMRATASEMGCGVRVGNVMVFTREAALNLAEELDSQGWELGPEDEADEDEDEDEDEAEEDEDEE